MNITRSRPEQVTLKGQSVELIGRGVNIGDPLPSCRLVGLDLSTVNLSDFKGKVLVINTVPSVDTPVCDTQAKRFNEAASRWADKATILCVSMDLPFALKRWQQTCSADKLTLLSDHRDAELGEAFGILIKDLRLLARCIFVADANGILKYAQYVPEITNQPDYDDAFQAIDQILS